MLTLSDFVTVVGICLTAFSLGVTIGIFLRK